MPSGGSHTLAYRRALSSCAPPQQPDKKRKIPITKPSEHPVPPEMPEWHSVCRAAVPPTQHLVMDQVIPGSSMQL